MKKYIIGVDEAGRGPWAGPVVAGACIFLKNTKSLRDILPLLNDSKKLSEKQREYLLMMIQELEKKGVLASGIGIVDNQIIDTLRIKKANKLAMQKALEQVIGKLSISGENLMIQIDGNDKYQLDSDILSTSIIRGDAKVKQISAASIIAKVTRDHIMDSFGKKYPNYGFELHKGYGTKRHSEALETYGICEIHRTSYAPIARILKKNGF